MTFKSLLLTLLSVSTCLANVEKTIFKGPPTVRVPPQHPTISDLRLAVLTTDYWSLKTQVRAAFPNEENPDGYTTWFLLNDLKEGQRYEARVCWPATQPTSFTLTTYPLNEVWSTPHLLQSLNGFSLTRQSAGGLTVLGPNADDFTSLLFLKVDAKADYFTTNKTLMAFPEPVPVEVILDPFLLNVLPRSLLPTILYVVAIAGAAWYVGGWVVAFLQGIGEGLADAKRQVERERKLKGEGEGEGEAKAEEKPEVEGKGRVEGKGKGRVEGKKRQ